MARTRKYLIGGLAVGESVVVPWIPGTKGMKGQDPIYAAIRQEERRFSKRFEKTVATDGLVVRRIG